MNKSLTNANNLIPYIRKATEFCRSITNKIAPKEEEKILVTLTKLQLDDIIFVLSYYTNHVDIRPARYYELKEYLKEKQDSTKQ